MNCLFIYPMRCPDPPKLVVSEAIKGMRRAYLERELARTRSALRALRILAATLRLERDCERRAREKTDRTLAEIAARRAARKAERAKKNPRPTGTEIGDLLLRYDAPGDPGKLYPLIERVEAVLRAAQRCAA